MLNVWKKFLTLEAAFPTLFNKKGAIPELSARVECGIPEAAGNQTERFGGRQVKKRAWLISLSLIIMNPSLKKCSSQTGPDIKLGGEIELDVGAFLWVSAVAWLWRGATSLTHFLGWMQESSEHLSPTWPLRLCSVPLWKCSRRHCWG